MDLLFFPFFLGARIQFLLELKLAIRFLPRIAKYYSLLCRLSTIYLQIGIEIIKPPAYLPIQAVQFQHDIT